MFRSRCRLTFTLLVLIASLALAFGVGCKKGGGGGNTLGTSGGDGAATNGIGGAAGSIEVWMEIDSGGVLEVSKSGSVDASFPRTQIASVPYSLGAVPLVVTGNLVVDLYSMNPPIVGTPYAVEGDDNLYISDGDGDLADEPAVTGIEVEAGASLTLPINDPAETAASFAFSDDIANFGVITSADELPFEQRGGLILFTNGQYIGSGNLETYGTSPGMNGGEIWIRAAGDVIVSGSWLSYGADNGDGLGGDGGDIELQNFHSTVGGRTENRGRLVSRGGDATGTLGSGGDGGEVRLAGSFDLWNSGDIDSSGGDGVGLAGSGGEGGLAEIETSDLGEVVNSGDIDTSGGDSQLDAGADGGEVTLKTRGGDLLSSGSIRTCGGDTSGAMRLGGDAGAVDIEARTSEGLLPGIPSDAPPGDIWISGALLACGGDAPGDLGQGGQGAMVVIFISNGSAVLDQSIHLLGYKSVNALGGDGGFRGGDSGGIRIDSALEDSPGDGVIDVEPPMNTSGGDADPGVAGSMGGDAGNIELRADVIGYGSATAQGGTGQTPGTDGTITPAT